MISLHGAAGRLAARVSASVSSWFRATGWWLPPVLVTALAVALLGCPSEPEHDTAAEPPTPETAAAAGGDLARGRYLTERVAMRIVCHSPKDEGGAVIPERKFQGAPMPVGGFEKPAYAEMRELALGDSACRDAELRSAAPSPA